MGKSSVHLLSEFLVTLGTGVHHVRCFYLAPNILPNLYIKGLKGCFPPLRHNSYVLIGDNNFLALEVEDGVNSDSPQFP